MSDRTYEDGFEDLDELGPEDREVLDDLAAKSRHQQGRVHEALQQIAAARQTVEELRAQNADLIEAGGAYRTEAQEELERQFKTWQEYLGKLLEYLEAIAPTEYIVLQLDRELAERGPRGLARVIHGEIIEKRGALVPLDEGEIRNVRKIPRRFLVRLPFGKGSRVFQVADRSNKTHVVLAAMAKRATGQLCRLWDQEDLDAKRILETPFDTANVDPNRLFDVDDAEAYYPYAPAPADRFVTKGWGVGVFVAGVRGYDHRWDENGMFSGTMRIAVVPTEVGGRSWKALEVYETVGDKLSVALPGFRRYILPRSSRGHLVDQLPPADPALLRVMPKLQFPSTAVRDLIRYIKEQAADGTGRQLLRGYGRDGILTAIAKRRDRRNPRPTAPAPTERLPGWWRGQRDVLRDKVPPTSPSLREIVSRSSANPIQERYEIAVFVDKLPMSEGDEFGTWTGTVVLAVEPSQKGGAPAKTFTILRIIGKESAPKLRGQDILVDGAGVPVVLTNPPPAFVDGSRIVCTKPVHAVLRYIERQLELWDAARDAARAAGPSVAEPKLEDFIGLAAFLAKVPKPEVAPAKPAVAGNGTAAHAEPAPDASATAAVQPLAATNG